MNVSILITNPNTDPPPQPSRNRQQLNTGFYEDGVTIHDTEKPTISVDIEGSFRILCRNEGKSSKFISADGSM